MDFEALINQVRPAAPVSVAVAAAEDDVVLKAVCEAHARGIASPILVGDAKEINAIAGQCGLDVSAFPLIEAAPDKAAAAAVSQVRAGSAAMLMKGKLQTADILRAVLDKENGLRGSGVLSHVGVLHAPALGRMVLITDAGMVTYPDLKTKVKLIENAVRAARGLGIQCPKVAPLAAVEVVNPDMQATVDAALLTVMNRRGQIKGCIVDGPLAMDLAVSEEAVRHKGIESPVAGKADILLMHNIDVANSVLKSFTFVGRSLFGGVVMGAAAPIVLTSRADDDRTKLYSIACAAAISGAR